MFSGIVETLGTIISILNHGDTIDFAIKPAMQFNDLRIGDSLSVNGICLTITSMAKNVFHVTAVPETLRVTNLKHLSVKSEVNLERSLPSGGRNNGHNVQGHVDATGKIISITPDGKEALLVKFSLPRALMRYVVNKGYIAIDGMSITVIQAEDEWFTVTFIPHTIKNTISKHYQAGTEVNIEVDMLAKYIEKLLEAYKK